MLVSAKNRRQRLEFVKRYINKDYSFWKNVIFTDESKINLFGNDGKINIWRKANQEWKVQNLNPTIKHGKGSVMMWGCVSAVEIGNLEFIERNMDKWSYLNILKMHLKNSAQKLGLLDSFMFYGGNDPKHASRIAQEWLLYNCPKLIHIPAQSPDLNIIEHVWRELKLKVNKREKSSKDQLKAAMRAAWENVHARYTNR